MILIFIPLQILNKEADGILTFSTGYVIRENGPYSYYIRVFPYHEKPASKQETGLILWG